LVGVRGGGGGGGPPQRGIGVKAVQVSDNENYHSRAESKSSSVYRGI
jgi:hypothetical protein